MNFAILQQRRADVIEDLAVHPLHVNEFAGIIEDVDRRRAALRGRPVAADAGDLLCGCQRNLIAVENVTRAFAADYIFGW